MLKVSKDEYQAFLAAYPTKLSGDVSGISEPPMESWNDFALGNWSDSMVAKHHRGTENYWIKPGPTVTAFRR